MAPCGSVEENITTEDDNIPIPNSRPIPNSTGDIVSQSQQNFVTAPDIPEFIPQVDQPVVDKTHLTAESKCFVPRRSDRHKKAPDRLDL